MCTLRYDAVDQPYSNIYLIELSESYSSVSLESQAALIFARLLALYMKYNW